VCEARDKVKVLLGVGCLLGIVGAAFSEKVSLMGTLMGVSSVLGMASLGIWIEWMKDAGLHSDDTDMGVGAWLITGGWLAALLGFVLCMVDGRCTPDENKTCCGDDGITVFGRLASFSTVGTWLLFLCAVTSPSWSMTDDINNAGGFCADPSSTDCTDNRNAHFGIWYYCVEERSAFFNNELVDVCLEWTKEVAVGRDDGTKTGMAQHIHGSVEAPFADGESRFSNIDAKAHREFVGFAVLAGFLCAVFADVMSEKVCIGMVCMIGASVAGFFSMCAWIDLQFKMNDDTGASDVIYAPGGAFIILAWMLAAFSAFAYCMNRTTIVQAKSSGGKQLRSRGSTSV